MPMCQRAEVQEMLQRLLLTDALWPLHNVQRLTAQCASGLFLQFDVRDIRGRSCRRLFELTHIAAGWGQAELR